jgi:hypothetical protein
MKKFFVFAISGVLLVATAGSAAAFDATIVKNKAKVKNVTVVKADTGDNKIYAGDDVKGGKIKTGDATAYGEVTNVVNTTASSCECDGFTLVKNKAKVKNVTIVSADSGDNKIKAEDDVKGGKIKTGDAGAGAVVTNVVNTTTLGGESEPEV